MADIENTPVEQLCYTWSDVGLSTVYAGFRIRAASPGLTEIYSERVKSMDRYMRYVLPPGTDRFAITPGMAPVCLAFVRTEWGEYILVHKKYVGEDGVGRLGNFFIHLLAFGPDASSKFSAQGTQALDEFSAQNAIWFWDSDIWKTSDQQLERRSNHLDPILLGDLYDYQRFRPDYTQLQRSLSFLIEAYLLRQPEQQLYIAAPASSAAVIATLITGLTDCLPRQLLAGLTFSTYEPDVAKATAQIVGTSWIPTAGSAGPATPVFAPSFYREKLAVNCSTGEQSPLQGHPLTVKNQIRAGLAPEFARYAAECLVADDMKALYELIEQAEKDPELTIERFLRLYDSEIRNRGTVSQDVIESYLDNPLYQIEKLSDPQFRESILKEVMSNPQWGKVRLHPHLASLREQSRKPSPKKATITGTGQRQNKRTSAKEPRRGGKKKGAVQQEQPSLTLAEVLALLARNAIPRVVSAMEKSTALEETGAGRDATYEANRRKYLERTATLLELMNCSLPPEETTRGWKELLDGILQRPGACRFLATNWDILVWLLKQWNATFPSTPEYDEAVHRVLVIPWSYLGEFLKLHLRERHGEWNIFVVDELIKDDSLIPQIAQYLGQNYAEEINGLIEQLLRKQDLLAQTAEFVIKLISNGYLGKSRYYSLIEQLLGRLIEAPYLLLAKDLVIALTRSGYSGKESYLRVVELLFLDLLNNKLQDESMDLFKTLVGNGFDKELLAPTVLRANLGLVKQVYPTQEEQAAFFARNGSKYLSTSEQMKIMLNLYIDLLQYPGRAQRLVVLLGAYQSLEVSKKEKCVLTVLSKTSPDKDDRLAVLKAYGKEYLQQSRHLAQFVVDSFRWLVQTGYPAKDLFFALFTSAASSLSLEELLKAAHLSVEESAEFFRTYGSVEAYFPFFQQSSATLQLLGRLAQHSNMGSLPEQAAPLSAAKMQVVFSWVAPSQLQRSLFRPDDVERILRTATLTPAEQQQFLERYVSTYPLLYQQLPIIVEYIGKYVSTFTADSLQREEAKGFLVFLSQKARHLTHDSYILQCIHYWGTINQYLDAPTANPEVLKALAIALSSLSLPNTPAFEVKLAGAFAQCVRNTSNLIAIMEYVKLIPKISPLQLLYSLAEESAKQYRGDVRDFLPHIVYVLSTSDLTITSKRQEHFIQQFLDRLLYHVDNLTIWENLNRLVTQQGLPGPALKRWHNYLNELKLSDKVTSGQDTANGLGTPESSQAINRSSSAPQTTVSKLRAVVARPASFPSQPIPLKRWWDYAMAETLIDAALKSKKVDRIANTWDRYGASIDEFYPEKVSPDEREQIGIAIQFIQHCRLADEQVNVAYAQQIVQLAEQIKRLSLKCTLSQNNRIALAQQRLRESASMRGQGPNPSTRSSSGYLPGGQVSPMPNIQSTRPAQNPINTLQKQQEGIQVHLDVKSKKSKHWWPRS